MKRNFLKNSLAALAFSFAIIASFAFSNVDDNLTEYIQKTGPQTCEQIPSNTCDELTSKICTYTIGLITYDVFDKQDEEEITICVNLLNDTNGRNP